MEKKNPGDYVRRPLVLYHGGCTDGFTAAWAVDLAFREWDGIEAMPVHYNSPPPDVDGREVIIVDFSYPRDVLIEMNEEAESLIVIDHHKTAMEALDGLDFAIFDMDRSGAGMAWDYFHEAKRPWLVDYVEDRDLWYFRLERSREANAYIHIQEQTFDRWDEVAGDGRPMAMKLGRVVVQTIQHYVEDTARKAVIADIAGHMVPVVNATYWHTSELLEKLAMTPLRTDLSEGMRMDEIVPEEGSESAQPPFAMSWYIRPDGKVSYSLRSRGYPDGREAFDVSALAKTFGGGGHRQAAGFAVDHPIHTNALIRP